MLHDNDILDRFGGISENNLLEILNDENTDDGTILSNVSSYYSMENIDILLGTQTKTFSLMSLNCQSINAKFPELVILINKLRNINFEFSVICLQETWLSNDADLSILQLPNYRCISKGRSCSQHGGLIVYLHENYNQNVYIETKDSDIWEGIFVKICNSSNEKNIEIANVYRPPNNNNDNINLFIEEISPFLEKMSKSKSVSYILGDFNINLLKIKERQVFNEFLENIMAYGFYPTVTLPTRLSESSATLIDNIFSNSHESNSSVSGIMINNMSDHLPCFHCFELGIQSSQPTKFTYKRNISQNSISNLYDYLI